MNRNKDVKHQPFALKEFCFWSDVAESPRPPSEAGAAMLELLERNLFPSFALSGPWVQDLQQQGKDAKPPERLCFAAEDAILLAPYRVDQSTWGGFLIALASAAGQTRQFASEAGDLVILHIPSDVMPAKTFAAAKAHSRLAIEGRENCG